MTNWRGILLDPDLAMKHQGAQGQSGYLSLGGTEATRIHEEERGSQDARVWTTVSLCKIWLEGWDYLYRRKKEIDTNLNTRIGAVSACSLLVPSA